MGSTSASLVDSVSQAKPITFYGSVARASYMPSGVLKRLVLNCVA